MAIRSPICAIEGHVDHGKTSILDQIRGTAVVKGEAGAITQAIGASIIPLETIKKVSGKLLETLKIKLTIPGLLFIDTPGHAAFTALRKSISLNNVSFMIYRFYSTKVVLFPIRRGTPFALKGYRDIA